MPGAALVSNALVAGLNSGTTSGINTTGATLLVIHVSYLAGTPPTVSDSKSNSWTPLTEQTTTLSNADRLYYVANPTVGTGHTFSFTGTGSSTALNVAAFSGVITVSPFDAENGNVGGPSSNGISGGPLTTTVVNELVVTGISFPNNTAAIDNSFIITDQTPLSGGSNFGGAFAYVIKAATGAFSPLWTTDAIGRRSATIASFIPDGNTPESVSDTLSFSESLGEGRGYAFTDTIAFSESIADTVTGGGAFIVPELLGDFVNLKDAAATDFVYSPPGGQRGNIDYDQIRRAARSGDGAKLHTLTGSVTTGHGVVFDANGNLIDSGSAPGGGGTVTSVAQTVPTGFTITGSPVTTSGSLDITLDSQAANKFLASPSNTSGTPSFRIVAAADLPLASSSAFGAVKVDNATITAAAGVISAVAGAAPGLVLLEQHTASSSATLDFTTAITSTYDTYLIQIIDLVPATNAVDLWMRMSTDGGSTYDTGNNYSYVDWRWIAGGSATGGATAQSAIYVTNVTDHVSSSTSWGVNGHMTLYKPGDTTCFKRTVSEMAYFNSSSNREGLSTRGAYESATAVNAFRFLFSSGNLASGIIRVYGYAK